MLESGKLGWGGMRSKTANQFDKDDPSNIDRYFLSAANGTAYKYVIHQTPSMQYFGTTHFIPCRKDDMLVCTAKSFA